MSLLPAIIYLWPGNTQIVDVQGLEDVTTGSFLEGATVTMSLLNQRGVIDPNVNELVMIHLSTGGNYRGTISSSFNALLGNGYTLRITAVQAGVQSIFSIPVNVVLRSVQ